MSSYVYVDHSQLEQAAKAVDEDINYSKTTMEQATKTVQSLEGSWQGTDSTTFQNRWNLLTNSNSTPQKMQTAQENYAACLRLAAKKYKQGQAHAIVRAKKI
jgi:uncharacterized protein YukE